MAENTWSDAAIGFPRPSAAGCRGSLQWSATARAVNSCSQTLFLKICKAPRMPRSTLPFPYHALEKRSDGKQWKQITVFRGKQQNHKKKEADDAPRACRHSEPVLQLRIRDGCRRAHVLQHQCNPIPRQQHAQHGNAPANRPGGQKDFLNGIVSTHSFYPHFRRLGIVADDNDATIGREK